MSTENEQLAEQLRKLRMDLTNAQAKLTDVIDRVKGANVSLVEPLPAVEQIRRQIRNGVLTDTVDLAAECAAANLDLVDRVNLAEELKKRREAA